MATPSFPVELYEVVILEKAETVNNHRSLFHSIAIDRWYGLGGS
jgi:hypothetical protein